MANTQDLQERKKLYQWELDDGRYPPHVVDVPKEVKKVEVEMFNLQALLQARGMISPVEEMISKQYTRLAPDPKDMSLDTLIGYNKSRRAPPGVNNHMLFPFNIGDRKSNDWYSDAVFAQQHFTGTNATTITLAGDWVALFTESAQKVQNEGILEILKSSTARLYVQDYSYFRSAMGLSDEQDLVSGDGRYGVAPVALFQLGDDGILHPLAIVIDYKGSMSKSVVIFNKRLTPSKAKLTEEAEDWPWRYAKTCVQAADWLRHEVSIHLVNTHLVEEASIVAANRTLPQTHIVYQLLYKHWDSTLSLNSQARAVLVPDVIAKIAPVGGVPLFKFLKHAYRSFDWKKLRIPKDLEDRGFADPEKPEFHNYAYARNMALMWPAIRSFVDQVLRSDYENDDKRVADDKEIQAFCEEMRSPKGANMYSFPEIKTLDELIDTVTMCIHIASPQHTAVNYLQQYYQVFVPNKPWAFYKPIPSSIDELKKYGAPQLRDALPFKHTKDWLIGSHLAYLLSFEVPSGNSLLTYAKDQSEKNSNQLIKDAAKPFLAKLTELRDKFREHSAALDDKETIYSVMDPAVTAVSILI